MNPFRIFVVAATLSVGTLPLLAQAPTAPPKAPVDPTAAQRRAVRAAPLAVPKAGPEPKPIQPTTTEIRDRNARLQIFLDRQQFAPGKIDGSWGLIAQRAWSHYEKARGLAPIDPIVAPPAEVLAINPLYLTYTVTAADATLVGEIAGSLAEKAKMKMLPYTSLGAMVSERFHCSPEFLKRLNPGLNPERIKVGSTLNVPNVIPFDLVTLRAERGLTPQFTQTSNTVVPVPGQLPLTNAERYNLRVSLSEKILEIREGTQLVASFPVTPGSKELPTPAGSWFIRSKVFLPEFRWDEAMLNTGKRSEQYYVLPPGPNNPVGVMWMGLSKDGIGLHGTNNPNTIGRAASHGCMRLANWDAVRVAAYVEKGTHVLIE